MDKRKEKDLTELMENGFEVDMPTSRNNLFVVKFHGPKDSPYEGGVWRVRVSLPDEYPFKSPSITFASRIYHTNIQEATGLICLNVINEDWSPTFKLLNVFKYYLPQLLLSPNSEDPMNKVAAAKMEDNREAYNQFVRDHCQKHAKPAEENISSSEGKVSVDERSSNDEGKDGNTDVDEGKDGNTDDEESKAENIDDEESKAENTDDEEDKAGNTDDEEDKAGNTDDEGKAGNTDDEEDKAGSTDDEEGKSGNTKDEEGKSGNTDDEEGKAGKNDDQ